MILRNVLTVYLIRYLHWLVNYTKTFIYSTHLALHFTNTVHIYGAISHFFTTTLGLSVHCVLPYLAVPLVEGRRLSTHA
jgi:hypothetical protein